MTGAYISAGSIARVTARMPCQAVVVRYAPDPSAGEALNFGVVLLAPDHHFSGARFVDSWKRITAAFPQSDVVHLRRMASTIERACAVMSSHRKDSRRARGR